MQTQAAMVSVQAWETDGILLERYAYTSGTVEPLPKHTHAEYQFGLSFDCQGEYHYRGARHIIPKGSLSVIHSGEIHAPSDRTFLPEAAHFFMVHLDPQWLQTVRAELDKKLKNAPFFPTVAIADPTLNRLFLALQTIIDKRLSQLEQDVALWDFLTHLLANHAANRASIPPAKPVHVAISRARDYLHAHYADDISLQELAAIADLSRFHLCRVFGKAIGVSPSAYQTQLRIAQARKLLAQGLPIATVAATTGFYDQSHFSWHFKRQVGTTPGNYGKSDRNIFLAC
ncbi:MAG: AraC family transcriptional regulator [Leptolyngbya sp. SIO1D8]|nr:AraC family transcriptional regulator [Leptolyngbya sp. SIO1D8]